MTKTIKARIVTIHPPDSNGFCMVVVEIVDDKPLPGTTLQRERHILENLPVVFFDSTEPEGWLTLALLGHLSRNCTCYQPTVSVVDPDLQEQIKRIRSYEGTELTVSIDSEEAG